MTATLTWSGVTARRMARHALADLPQQHHVPRPAGVLFEQRYHNHAGRNRVMKA
jgi:hypothetical protein